MIALVVLFYIARCSVQCNPSVSAPILRGSTVLENKLMHRFLVWLYIYLAITVRIYVSVS